MTGVQSAATDEALPAGAVGAAETASPTGEAQVLDGTATAATIKAELAERVAVLRERGVVPGLGTVLVGQDPMQEVFTREYFGPVLAVHVWDDSRPDGWTDMLRQMESVAPYALTGAVVAQDRAAVAEATQKLRFAAGNFYVNDKPTGAVVGQQPFGGARGSGTNDKAGSQANLQRWTSTRIIKETFAPPTDYRYPHMG